MSGGTRTEKKPPQEGWKGAMKSYVGQQCVPESEADAQGTGWGRKVPPSGGGERLQDIWEFLVSASTPPPRSLEFPGSSGSLVRWVWCSVSRIGAGSWSIGP